MAKPVARGYFDPEVVDSGLKCEDPSLAVQASKDECDINVIVKRYMRTGELPGVRQGVYADISQMGNLRECIELVEAADLAFASLPAEIRREFDNDPVKLVAFAADERNYDRAVELGLAVKREPTPSVRPPAAGQAAPPQPPAAGTPPPT